ncbi:MAG: DUF11 domain-containing protein [Rubrivivax sp.]|nr:DUF11 domain-containing protein [Pyrinomonadaceae bacterium]
MSKSADESVPRGGNITYLLGVSNNGPDDAANVTVIDQIPENTTFVEATASQGTVSVEGNTLTISFGTIPAFEIATATLVVQVDNDVPRGTTISNTATVASNALDADDSNNSATALTNVTGPFAGDMLISEFRLRGPSGTSDEFIEIYNNIGTDQLVSATDGSAGYAVVASDGVARCTIPNGTRIPNGGHYLCVNSGGYSLDAYPAGNPPIEGGNTSRRTKSPRPVASSPTLRSAGSRALPRPVVAAPSSFGTAIGDATYTADIPDNAGIALFSSSTDFTLANRLDAVGSTSEENSLYKEGAGYPAIAATGLEHSFVRDECGKSGSITTFGTCPVSTPRDTDNNAADFFFVDTSGALTITAQRLGAPGPQNLSSPVQSNSTVTGFLLDTTVNSSAPPNRVRNFGPGPNAAFGTLEIRRRIVNATDQNVVRLRFRVIDITTFPAPAGVADLRPLSSTLLAATVNDPQTCDTAPTPCTVAVLGTTLEEPPTQPNGGGFNSSLSVDTVTLATPIAPGASVNVRFVLGIQQTGDFRFFVNIEALTAEPPPPPPDPEPEPELRPSKPVKGVKPVR